ncbi:MAG: class I SAM-dependent methyltransferase [Gemmatimonadota bacterium]
MSGSFLESLRDYELEQVVPLMPPGSRILEIGAGAGWQSRRLAELGHEVVAIDVALSEYEAARVWPVAEYDGRHIPFPDATFDVIFSSNVLEHIPHVREFQSEMLRVLRPGGMSIHILPTGSWRWWSSLTYYLHRVRSAAALASGSGTASGASASLARARRRGLSGTLARAVLPPRHGELGNVITELALFSRFRWRRLFRECGWTIVLDRPTGLFYTGYSAFGASSSLAVRRSASLLLGSACRIFVLRAAAS